MLTLATLARSQDFYYKPFPDVSRPVRSSPPEPSYPSHVPNYNFQWQVLDTYSGNDYGHKESREDKVTTGSYHVALPDGRVQRVTYSVDGYGRTNFLSITFLGVLGKFELFLDHF